MKIAFVFVASALAAALAPGVQAEDACPFLYPGSTYETYGQQVIAGDFNSDGITDLAVAYQGDPFAFPDPVPGHVAILLGNGSGGLGDGTFGEPQHAATGGAKAMATGDFNGDGITDIAVASLTSENTISILLGNGTGGAGDGTFGDPTDYPAHEAPWSLTTGDFNSDGITDLAVVNNWSNDVSILLGNGAGGVGDGTFGDPAHYAAHDQPWHATTGDFDADGITDIAVANAVSADVSILLGNGSAGAGDGTFGGPVHYSAGEWPQAVATGDFNEDGITDLAVANESSYDVSILLGNGSAGVGDGTFGDPVHYLVHDAPRSIVAEDLNSDGITDIAVTNHRSSDVSILLGNGSAGTGDGTFGDAAHYATTDWPSWVATGDFNGDGITDLAVTAVVVTGGLSVLLGSGSGGIGDGTFAVPVHYPAHGVPRAVTTGDFNDDGITDLAVANWESFDVSILLGNGSTGLGDGTFAEAVHYSADGQAGSVATGDFNGDGITDLAVATPDFGDITILPGNGSAGVGDGTFGIPAHFPADTKPDPKPVSVAVGDFNGDGIADLAVANEVSWNVSILIGNGSDGVGDGTFQAPIPYPADESPVYVTTGDFNEDGITDLAVANRESDNVSILIGNGSTGVGDGTFGNPNNYPAHDEASAIATGDFNVDGITDLAVATPSSNDVSILIGNGSAGVGDGTFADPTHYPSHGGPSFVTAADLNGDGVTDLAAPNRTTGDISILPGNGSGGVGDGTFGAPVHFAANERPVFVATGDFNGDEMTDLAVVNQASGDVSILVNLCRKVDMPEFIRGDCNPDGSVKLADVITTLLTLFKPGFEPPCRKACDVDDDHKLTLADAIAGLLVVFIPGTEPPPAPFPGCGHDPTPAPADLSCMSFPLCE